MGSFNRLGQPDEAMKKDRNRGFGIDEAKKRPQREDLASAPNPQRGVDALETAFPSADSRPPGVIDSDAPEKPDV
jgi:hypothetical protein